MTARPIFPAALDAQRALQARAFIVLFETLLIDDQAETKASLTVTTIDSCGLGQLEVIHEITRLTMFGIRAETRSSRTDPLGVRTKTRNSMTDLLRNWQSAALDRLAMGVRP